MSDKRVKHGYSTANARHPLYKVWLSMRMRCRNIHEKNYGGRGIGVVEEWNDPAIFIHWCLQNGWEFGLELDRENNSQGYSPDNCRFVTTKENARNTRRNKTVWINGVRLTLIEAVERHCYWATGIGTQKSKLPRAYKAVHMRIKGGWSVSEALFTGHGFVRSTLNSIRNALRYRFA